MTSKERILKIKSMPKGPDYYFASACHNMLCAMEINGQYVYMTRIEAENHQKGIKQHFQIKTKLHNTTLTLCQK